MLQLPTGVNVAHSAIRRVVSWRIGSSWEDYLWDKWRVVVKRRQDMLLPFGIPSIWSRIGQHQTDIPLPVDVPRSFPPLA